MYARMVTGQVLPSDIDECLRLWNEAVAPSALFTTQPVVELFELAAEALP